MLCIWDDPEQAFSAPPTTAHQPDDITGLASRRTVHGELASPAGLEAPVRSV